MQYIVHQGHEKCVCVCVLFKLQQSFAFAHKNFYFCINKLASSKLR